MMTNRLLMTADEGFHSSKKEEADKFKPLITETTTAVRRSSTSLRISTSTTTT